MVLANWWANRPAGRIDFFAIISALFDLPYWAKTSETIMRVNRFAIELREITRAFLCRRLRLSPMRTGSNKSFYSNKLYHNNKSTQSGLS